MKYAVAGLALLTAIAAPTTGIAQLMCATSFGACMMATGLPGGPCFCATPNGPIQGIAQIAGGAMLPSVPQFCCTPAGRLGPYANSSIGPGQACQVMTPTGVMIGQACF